MSISRRYPDEPRRSNRDRHHVYKSLDENIMGIRTDSVLFHQLVNESNVRKRQNYYQEVNDVAPKRNRYRSTYSQRSHYATKHATDSEGVDEYEEEDDGDVDFHDQKHHTRAFVRNSLYLHENHSNTRNKLRNGSNSSKHNNSFQGLNETVDSEFAPTMYERIKSRHTTSKIFIENDDENDVSVTKKRKSSRKLLRELNSPVVAERGERINESNEEEVIDENRKRVEKQDKILKQREEAEVESEEDTPKQYHFRRQRAQVTRFDYIRDIPRRCNRRLTRSSTYNRVITSDLSYLDNQRNKKQIKSRRRKELSTSSSTSSLSEDDITSIRNDLRDEAHFERRKLKSLQQNRRNFMPINISQKDLGSLAMSARQKARKIDSVCADIDSMELDKNVCFESIGGLNHYIQSLKEIVVFPLLYPEFFKSFDVNPPTGVLFYGPPGTGKTLVARALANECSNNKKVAFFMRKGADCLSKWVGESERQLRLLFDQAYLMRPSIIFFDEIDGLAPVRSSRQDQIHSSIVSTLLALMDGLDKRKEIIVIGATNRLDSIDPALRRPGRFDREMRFDLPDKVARQAILNIHTKLWNDSKPSEQDLEWLAEKTNGYCGADLKALCTESVLIALRENYPQIYLTTDKLLINTNQISIKKHHFEDALRLITPASRRDFSVMSHQINSRLRSIIEPIVEEIIIQKISHGYSIRKNANNLWSSDLERVVMALKVTTTVSPSRLLLHGNGSLGQTTHYLPALVSHFDHLPLFSLACEQIFTSGSIEDNILQIVRSALRASNQGTPVVFLLPDIDILEKTLPTTTWKMLLSALEFFLTSSTLIMASIKIRYCNASYDIKQLFRTVETYEILLLNKDQREKYFTNVFNKCYKVPFIFDASKYTMPEKVSKEIPIRKISPNEYKILKNNYQQLLRQFRIFLRDLLGRLVRDRRFNCFNLPVDIEDANDYYDIIKNPMCLTQMMDKIDDDCYKSKDEFLSDIRLIRINALEYNPSHNLEGKTIRHNANALLDMAEALFETDLNDDLVEKLEETAKLLKEAEETLTDDITNLNDKKKTKQNKIENSVPEKDENVVNKTIQTNSNHENTKSYNCLNAAKRHRTNSIVKKYKSLRNSLGDENFEKNNKQILRKKSSDEMVIDEGMEICNNAESKTLKTSKSPIKKNGKQNLANENSIIIDSNKIDEIREKAVLKSDGYSLPNIECFGLKILQCIETFAYKLDRTDLPLLLEKIVTEFQI